MFVSKVTISPVSPPAKRIKKESRMIYDYNIEEGCGLSGIIEKYKDKSHLRRRKNIESLEFK